MKSFKQFIAEDDDIEVSKYFHKGEEAGSFGHRQPKSSEYIKQRVNLKHIAPTQHTMSQQVVDRYAEKNPHRPPPFLHKENDTNYHVIDGHHRIAAAIKRGDTHIDSHVTQMSIDDNDEVQFSKPKP